MYLEELAIKLAILSERIRLEAFKSYKNKPIDLRFLSDTVKMELVNLLMDVKNANLN